jgi:ABC-type dipeptide/oligopeptide/nickel transport system permease subunit
MNDSLSLKQETPGLTPPVNALAKRKKPTASLWADAWRRMRRNTGSNIGLIVIAFLVVTSLAAPLLAPYDPYAVDFEHVREAPTRQHWMGTDLQGRDILSRMLYGGQASLAVGFFSQLVIMAIGITIGAVSGYYGGVVDTVIMRLTDVLYAFPSVLFLIILLTLLGHGFINLIIAMTVTGWLGPARLVRGEVLQLKEREFIEAARCVGARDREIIFKHLFPNLLGPIIVSFTLGIPGAIMAEAGLSFLGMGLIPPTPSWGTMLNMGFTMFRVSPHLVIFPASVIAITMVAFLYVGDGMRDAFDPHLMR